MAGAQRVLEMQLGTVVLADCRLDAAFSHHGVAVAHAQLGRQDDLHALLRSRERGRASAPAAADDQHVGGHELRAGQIDVVDQRIRLEMVREVRLARGTPIRPDCQ